MLRSAVRCFYVSSRILLLSTTAAFGQAQQIPQGNGPIPATGLSADNRAQFVKSLNEKIKGSGEIIAASGDRNETLEATVAAGADAVALLGNNMALAFNSRGFEKLHITLPDDKRGNYEWIADIGPGGYSHVKSNLYCKPPSASKYCSLGEPDTGSNNASPPEDLHGQIAKALTDQSAKYGKHIVYNVCGKDGSRDGLCVVDQDASSDGFVGRIRGNNNLGQQLYSEGFREILISNGTNGYWGFIITSTGFAPMRDGSSVNRAP